MRSKMRLLMIEDDIEHPLPACRTRGPPSVFCGVYNSSAVCRDVKNLVFCCGFAPAEMAQIGLQASAP